MKEIKNYVATHTEGSKWDGRDGVGMELNKLT